MSQWWAQPKIQQLLVSMSLALNINHHKKNPRFCIKAYTGFLIVSKLVTRVLFFHFFVGVADKRGNQNNPLPLRIFKLLHKWVLPLRCVFGICKSNLLEHWPPIFVFACVRFCFIYCSKRKWKKKVKKITRGINLLLGRFQVPVT